MTGSGPSLAASPVHLASLPHAPHLRTRRMSCRVLLHDVAHLMLLTRRLTLETPDKRPRGKGACCVQERWARL